MKKLFFVLGISVAFATAANADSFTHVVHTSDCRPEAMRALMDRVSAENRDVITKVVCDVPQVMQYTQYEPVDQYFEYDLSNVPVVDCVPGPIVSPCDCR